MRSNQGVNRSPSPNSTKSRAQLPICRDNSGTELHFDFSELAVSNQLIGFGGKCTYNQPVSSSKLLGAPLQ